VQKTPARLVVLLNSILYHCLIVQVEFFQDDVFPDTKVTWEPALTATDWFSGNLNSFSADVDKSRHEGPSAEVD